MRALIQKCNTGLYLCDGKNEIGWSADVAKARNFRRGEEAIGYAIKHKLPGCQVILSFPDPKYDIVIPL
jgi:hypothetical protein